MEINGLLAHELHRSQIPVAPDAVRLESSFLSTAYALAIVSATLVSFVLAQSAFWFYYGSTQRDVLIKEKMAFLSDILQQDGNEALRTHVCLSLSAPRTSQGSSTTAQEDPGAQERAARERQKARDRQNVQRMWSAFSGLVGVSTFVFVCLVLYILLNRPGEGNVVQRAHRNAFYFALLFVVFSFSTEVVLFVTVIRPHVIIGDVEIAHALLVGGDGK